MDIYERLKKSGYNCTDDDLLILGLMEKIRNKEKLDDFEFETDPDKMTDEYIKKLGEWLEKQPKYEPPEFTFITKLKENKKFYYKEDD